MALVGVAMLVIAALYKKADLSIPELIVWIIASFAAVFGVVQLPALTIEGRPGYLTVGFYWWLLQLVGVIAFPLILEMSPWHLIWWFFASFLIVTFIGRIVNTMTDPARNA